MSLDQSKLEKVRRFGNGSVQARCPACAEAGNDRTGNHLRIYPDGRFGCCVNPGDRQHRKRIFALAGLHDPPRVYLRRTQGETISVTRTVFTNDLRSTFGPKATTPTPKPTLPLP